MKEEPKQSKLILDVARRARRGTPDRVVCEKKVGARGGEEVESEYKIPVF